ncbi:MAG: sulfur carrier protein [Planctomycetota bacterium]|jgi:sulfur carrier protein
MIKFQVNGKTHEGQAGMTVVDLLNELEVEHQRLAVELNEDVIAKTVYATTVIQSGDEIEVVSFVGGG